jgi:hypothetical protein
MAAPVPEAPPRAPARSPRRLVVVALLVVAVAWLGFRAVRAFDQDRHAAEAAAVLSAPDKVTHQLPPAPAPGGAGGAVHSPPDPSGRLSYRPGTWLSVVELEGLDPVVGDERYLVFLRNWAGWTLAGSTSPRPDGTAQVRSGAEPRPPTIYEVIVTRAVDDATSIPHGQPVLQWFDASLAPPKVRRFDFARGA